MPKYYYKPIKDVVQSVYMHHTGVDFFADPDFELAIEVVVTAENEDASRSMRIGVTDINMWELDRIED